MRLHIPNATTRSRSEKANSKERIELPVGAYNPVVLHYLLKILELANTQQTLEIVGVGNLISYFASKHKDLDKLPHHTFVTDMVDKITTIKNPEHTKLNSIPYKKTITSNQLIVTANKPMPQIDIQIHKETPWIMSLLQENFIEPSLVMRLYPSLFKGQTLDVPKGYTVLLHPDEWQDSRKKWRPIAILDNDLQDISVGFVYSFIKDNNIIIDAGANKLRLNKIPIANPKISKKDASKNWVPVLWFVALAILLILIYRYKKK